MVEQFVDPEATGVLNTSILIVDDDSAAWGIFVRILEAEGYRVHVAPDAQSAFAEVERAVPAAIILDLHLPITDGLEVLRQLRATARTAHVPVAMVTADHMVDEWVARELQVLNARLYFKPIWGDDLIRVVRDLISGT